MKRFFIATFLLCCLALTSFALAQDREATTSAVSPLPSDTDKVKILKDKLATKVAELKATQTRGFHGEISSLAKTSFTLVTQSSEVKIRFSDDTLIFKLGDKRTEGKLDDLKNNLSVSVLGLFDEEASQQTAKIILIETTFPRYFNGTVTKVDKDGATITIKNSKNEEIVFDYEKTTKAFEYQKDATLGKSGLSRIIKDDLIEFWAVPNEDDAQGFKAMRIIRIPLNVFDSQAENSPAPTPPGTPESSPKASPKSSPKPTPNS